GGGAGGFRGVGVGAVGRGGAFARFPRGASLRPAIPLSFEVPVVVRNSPAARRAVREATRQAAQAAELAALPVHNPHAAGIDVGDGSHWACVGSTPDGSDTARELPAHTAGLRQLAAWLQAAGATSVAPEAP